MNVKNIMFSLIRSEVLGEEIDALVRSELTDDIYNELYHLSKKHDLSHIVANALTKLNALKNDEYSAKFNRQLMIALYRDTQREYALNLLSSALEDNQISYILLKGMVIRCLYPQRWMRTSCDIDILVQEQDTDRVQEALCNIGFLRIADGSTHDYSYESPNKVHIEVHYTLQQDGNLTSADTILQAVWESYSFLDDEDRYRYCMTPEVFIVYHMAHLGRHLLHGGCGIRPFVDLWLINQYFKFDSEKLKVLLDQSGLTDLYNISTKLSKVWMEDCQHSDVTRNLEEYVLSGGVYGTVTNAAMVKAAKGVGKVRSLFSIMFLPKESLQVLYPRLKRFPVLFPFYQVKRWFRFFNKNKRIRVKKLANARNSVSASAENTTRNLLQRLGLN